MCFRDKISTCGAGYTDRELTASKVKGCEQPQLLPID